MSQIPKQGESSSRLLDRQLGRARVRVGFNPAEMGMAPLSLEMLVAGQPAPVDFFLPMLNKETKRVEMSLAAEKGEPYKAAWRKSLLKTGQKRVFVRLEDGEALTDYFERHASDIIDHPDASLSKKRRIIKEMASLNLRVLFGGELSPKALDNSVQQAQQTVLHLAREAQILTRLAEVLSADYSIYAHSVNVCMLAMAFGRWLGLPESRVQTLGVGGMLHDVGMARLPPGLLDKPGPLTPREKAVVQRHPQAGYKMLLPVGAAPYDVLMIVLNHHENVDGSGYPGHLKGDKTPYLARVIKVADAYDAMTSQRPHRKPKSAVEAANTLLEQMNLYGKDLAPAFVRFLGSPAFSQ